MSAAWGSADLAAPDPILERLAAASLANLSYDEFVKLWERITTVRLETITAPAEGSLRCAQLRKLDEDGVLESFVRAWTRLHPRPRPEEQEAVTRYFGNIAADLSRWNDADSAAKQAALTSRDAFLNDNDMFELFRTFFPRVCCIVGKTEVTVGGLPEVRTIGGTGCLVAHDLVLTSWHVIEPLLNAADGMPRAGAHGHFAVFFDHIRKEILPDHKIDYPGVKRVSPAEEWYAGGSRRAESPVDFGTDFDFALIRLDMPIGLAARNGRFGEPRGWIRIPGVETIALPQRDAALVCPQHPGGLGRGFAFGRALQLYESSDSRLAYSLSSAEGSSGSPVLSVRGDLVALHEAEGKGAGPRDPPPNDHNRGVLLKAFAALANLRIGVQEQEPKEIVGLWAIRTATDPRHPLLGRGALLKWIDEQIAATPTSELVYAVTGKKKTGKSFSTDILRTRLQSLPDRVLVFRPTASDATDAPNRDSLLLPERPDVLLAALAGVLGLDASTIPKPPPEFQFRSTGQGAGIAEDLKLNDWASSSLTGWLVKAMDAANVEASRRLWIVLDLPPLTPFGPWMQSFLKSMSDLAAGNIRFRIFRWIYLDYDPVFLGQIRHRHEKLSPLDDILREDVREFLERMFAATGGGPPVAEQVDDYVDFVETMKGVGESQFWTFTSRVLTNKISRRLALAEALA
jgi:hypothetical protein